MNTWREEGKSGEIGLEEKGKVREVVRMGESIIKREREEYIDDDTERKAKK